MAFSTREIESPDPVTRVAAANAQARVNLGDIGEKASQRLREWILGVLGHPRDVLVINAFELKTALASYGVASLESVVGGDSVLI